MISEILPALLVVVLVMAGVDYYRKDRTASVPQDVIPPGLNIFLPVTAATDVKTEGWLLYPEAAWTVPSDAKAKDDLCDSLVRHLKLVDPQSATLLDANGETMLRCFPDD